VGRRRRSLAGYYLHNQREVDRLLEALLAWKRAGHSGQEWQEVTL
jgi:hypothetical protein